MLHKELAKEPVVGYIDLNISTGIENQLEKQKKFYFGVLLKLVKENCYIKNSKSLKHESICRPCSP